ncbi:hypothetical protein COLO4_12096 [Corchorus olitorius]|uniref:Uncharacterized protein n=1 Tax=Corchorus olitorius TaxID=93759 RepID=A0A1R3K291_9ROSI|nr:hypothetical protein COLO4_12096 [Corchorus olitorius]
MLSPHGASNKVPRMSTNLWIELTEGESKISDTTPPIRTVNCAVVRILSQDNKKILLESHQELSDGSTRQRSRPLSEKMKEGEKIEDAASRAVKEELGGVRNLVMKIVPDSCEIKEENRESGSFPELASVYVVHTVDAHVEGLAADVGEFYTEEEEYKDCGGLNGVVEKAVHVKKHYWKWVDLDHVVGV